MEQTLYQRYLSLLQQELIPAMGCTEPIALAYCAAAAWQAAGGGAPELAVQVEVTVSGNIIKNVKSVIVPNTGGLRGIETAVAAGLVSGQPDRKLEVLAALEPSQQVQIRSLLRRNIIRVFPAQNDELLYIEICLRQKNGVTARAVLQGNHINLLLVERDGKVIHQGRRLENSGKPAHPMSVREIYDFAQEADIQDLEPLVGRQIDCNLAIAQAGMEGSWGANVGRTLRQVYGEDVRFLARAFAAAGSDARMSGCEMPVIIVSGSGNQGITASVPVAVYAKAVGADRERLLRAVTLSDLVTIHQKTGIGCLSAFCGATCAGCGAGAGIAYLLGGDYKTVAHTIVNALAVVSGMVCDGAKASCAAKIAAAIDAGILGYELYCHGQEFLDGDGIIRKGVDNTIGNVGRMARSGMRETDRVILDIMCGC
ncbi:MAG TPA: serine dehydratase subunit alpha family protein [Candidatus Faecousia gallistercoris]|nr:serine dehydratase subunit alpha family protein [Candidatus Faecousia gallistercoris]